MGSDCVDHIVETLINAWKETRKLTYDFVNEVPMELLNKKLPRPGLDTFAKHIYEMALVQKAYVDVLKGKPLDFSEVEGITFGKEDYVAEDKDELIKLLKDVDTYFYNVVKEVKDWNNMVEVFGVEVPKYSILELMIRHETFHHGQFVAFSYLLKIKLPETWIEAWALPIEEEK